MVAMLDIPCVKCGWKLKGYHLCLFNMRDVEEHKAATTVDYEPPKPRRSRARDGANRSESVRAARAKEPGRRERDAEIIRLYDEEELSMNGVARQLGVDFRTVKKVLHTAANAEKIVIRQNLGGRPRQLIGQA
jgi:DNA-directed RNA polymerase specialized sigma24 family protein